MKAFDNSGSYANYYSATSSSAINFNSSSADPLSVTNAQNITIFNNIELELDFSNILKEERE